jgi:hypothetical protein
MTVGWQSAQARRPSLMRNSRLLVVLLVPLLACAHGGRPPSWPEREAGAPARALGRGQEWLAPGRYMREDFTPRLTFEVGPGWTAEQVAAGFFDVQRDVGTPDVIAVQFANVVGEGSDAVIRALRSSPKLRVGEAATVRVGGWTGTRVVVETRDAAGTDPPTFREVLRVPAGPISIAAGRRLQVTLLDTTYGVLGILVGGSIRQWERTRAEAEPIVESVRIER